MPVCKTGETQEVRAAVDDDDDVESTCSTCCFKEQAKNVFHLFYVVFSLSLSRKWNTNIY